MVANQVCNDGPSPKSSFEGKSVYRFTGLMVRHICNVVQAKPKGVGDELQGKPHVMREHFTALSHIAVSQQTVHSAVLYQKWR